jgi:predicted DNA-binding protein (MmcQ/YjbR family)
MRMNAERAREFLLKLPHVVEAEQWGGLLYWVGDKAIGGKTFVHLNLEAGQGHPAMFPAGPERFAELCERDGVIPAPYAARNFWVAVERWDVLRDREWEEELRAAHDIVYEKLQPRTKAVLAMPKAEQKKLVTERKKLLAEREAAKCKAKKKR